ncbi:NlpC/P60 family protein [Sediminibacillus halophilus]|uniref:Peptidoglycan endopeptidase LytE n=1 Tax=Sediminibacillus halophilus TaxID=482461 RepID=A0A1G9U809_9BACI|nr:NlpC/P60 family protein [Sediminibacillus halophilus]SDM55814.1 peptidoglycan endopeptidase LytE [Sediminibacillus halophilus]
MKTKKTLMSFAATVAIASAFTTNVEAASYTVKSGDTLWGISQKYGTSVSNLQSINSISGHIIYPGQVVETDSNKSTTTSSNNTASSSSSTTYKVKAGDTLSHIGVRYGVSVSSLKKWNNLSSDLIFVGQTLKINGTSSSSPNTQVKSSTVSSGSAIVDEAKRHVGTPYAWGGTSPSGFDCSGFIYYVFNKAGQNLSRTNAAGYYNQSTKISSPQPGDLVFFKNTYKSGISHMGIYAGNNQFVHASSSGVQLTSLSNSYWKGHFAGYGSL